MSKALIVKIISKDYTIKCPDGTLLKASLAGKMRKYDYPVVGDEVEYAKVSDRYIIKRHLPRRNYLLRPNLANIDQVIIAMSMRDPDFSFELCNRMIILVEYNDIRPIICITKSDLVDDENVKSIRDYYSKMGYEVHETGIDDDASSIKAILADKITALCGQSGVGKSTLLNKLNPLLGLKTQAISKALNRGKHTTRHVELYPCYGGLLADTPGFSSLDLSMVNSDELAKHISAFSPYINECRFLDCKHLKEPDCAIKEAVEKGKIPKSFYKTYEDLMSFLKENNIYGDRHRSLK